MSHNYEIPLGMAEAQSVCKIETCIEAEPPVASLLSMLGRSLEELSACVDQLGGRLQPVLLYTSAAAMGVDEEEKTPPMSDLEIMILSHNKACRELITRLNNLRTAVRL